MQKEGRLNLDRLYELLSYNPHTGEFTWISSPRNKNIAGKKAGTINGCGYIQVQIDGHRYLAHRLAWFYMYGKWPSKHIDHLSRVRTDNRICNLRDVDSRENHNNRSNNSSGFPGVSWNPDRSKWRAHIRIDGKLKSLGGFDSPERASIAYRLERYWNEKFNTPFSA
ncbi:HNH endonuclease signature motif containing protein [Enterobacter oligotrophicus]